MPTKMAVGTLVAGAAIALACSSGGKDAVTEAGSGGNANPAAQVAGLKQPARDGKFEFGVAGIQCGATKVGPTGFSENAQGEFCFVSVSVKNIGKEAQLF